MSREPDYYAIIQVHPRAEREVIEAAYRRLAAKYHPDLDHSPGATDRMKLLNAAYDVLSDPEKRRSYDLRRGIPLWGQRGQSGSGRQESSRPSYSSGLGSAALLIVTMLLASAVLRFAPRLLPVAILLFLVVGLIVAWRKG